MKESVTSNPPVNGTDGGLSSDTTGFSIHAT
jgi:hypothetical protein